MLVSCSSRSSRAVALFRAYFADTSPKEQRTGRFGLIGVITSASLFIGPSIGGEVARQYGRRAGCWLSAALCMLAALVAFLWRPDESHVEQVQMKRSKTAMLDGEELQRHLETHKTVGGVKMVKIDLSDLRTGGAESEGQLSPREAGSECCNYKPCRMVRKAWRFAKWLAQYDLYPLLSLNFFFRFAFAAYKSVFAFFCMALLHYGSREVGFLLSCMGIGGMFVQVCRCCLARTPAAAIGLRCVRATVEVRSGAV